MTQKDMFFKIMGQITVPPMITDLEETYLSSQGLSKFVQHKVRTVLSSLDLKSILEVCNEALCTELPSIAKIPIVEDVETVDGERDLTASKATEFLQEIYPQMRDVVNYRSEFTRLARITSNIKVFLQVFRETLSAFVEREKIKGDPDGGDNYILEVASYEKIFKQVSDSLFKKANDDCKSIQSVLMRAESSLRLLAKLTENDTAMGRGMTKTQEKVGELLPSQL